MCAAQAMGMLNRQAMEICNRGDYARSVSMLKDALAMSMEREATLQEAMIRNNLGLVLQLQGCESSASMEFVRALEVVEQTLGRDNPLFLKIQSNIKTPIRTAM